MNAHLFNKFSKIFLLLIFAVGFFPRISLAAISISEVAWMGSADSANYEWIELHNDGASESVDGWTLNDGMNLQIELVGTIPASSYAVLERTSEASAIGSAFLIYTGALVNTGAALKLNRADGSLVDQVSGGENWSNIGGDNVTKETAQYTSGGWVTAAATPGRGITASEVSAAVTEAVANETTAVTKSSGSSGSTAQKPKVSEPVRLIIPDVTLKLSVEAQTVGYVNQAINFKVKASDIGDTLIDSLTYEWNFGDGMTATQKETAHTFLYPGTYVVTVYGNFKRQEQIARHEITILPVMVSLTSNDHGDVQINNDSPYEIDVSGYAVRGGKTFVFPPRSIMLPNQTITIPKSKLGSNANLAVLYDNAKSQVASLSTVNKYSSLATVKETDFLSEKINNAPLINQVVTEAKSPELFGFANEDEAFAKINEEVEGEETVVEIESDAKVDTDTQSASVISATAASERWTYLALIVVLLLGIAGVYLKPNSIQND